jgi:hypothetical protein
MKHLLLLIVVVVASYFAYVISDSPARRAALRQITRHALRLDSLILVLLLLVWAAIHLSSTPLI